MISILRSLYCFNFPQNLKDVIMSAGAAKSIRIHGCNIIFPKLCLFTLPGFSQNAYILKNVSLYILVWDECLSAILGFEFQYLRIVVSDRIIDMQNVFLSHFSQVFLRSIPFLEYFLFVLLFSCVRIFLGCWFVFLHFLHIFYGITFSEKCSLFVIILFQNQSLNANVCLL